MTILVIGLGSMGKRRIRLLKKLRSDIVIIGIDSNQERAKGVEREYHIEVCCDLDQAIDTYKPKCVLVCTSPETHARIIYQCLQKGMNVFTEINLINDGYVENIRCAKEKNRVLFLSSTFLYRDEITHIMAEVKESRGALNYSYHVGQYLPDWHPWESYKNYFIGNKKTNGCREILAIELPWIIHAFGEIDSVKVMSGKNTDLDVDYYDNYLILIRHKTGHKGVLAVDVMSRKAVRNLEIYGEQLYVSWDGTPMGLKKYDCQKKVDQKIDLYETIDTIEGYASFVIENAYENELKSFLETVECGKKIRYTFEEDLVTLKWIDRIEKKDE